MSKRSDAARCFAVCAPGFEPYLSDELDGLGMPNHPTRGGCSFRATTRELYVANLWLRTATRVLVRVGEFKATRFDVLEGQLGLLAWDPYIESGRPLVIRATSHGSRIDHTGAIAERVARAAGGTLTSPGGPDGGADGGALVIVARVVEDRFTISIDASGEPLHRRGWRLETAKAPIRETLAATMLAASGWTPDQPLIDPMAGAGTIVIEAAAIAAGLAPGRLRSFGFQDWPGFEPGTWASVKGEAAGREQRDGAPAIVGSDRDEGGVQIARRNAERAGVADLVTFEHHSISDAVPPDSDAVDSRGWIISNPPYGRRVGAGGDLRNLYARLGDVARRRFADWGVGLLVDDLKLAKQTKLALTEQFKTSNGGVKVSFQTHNPPPEPVL